MEGGIITRVNPHCLQDGNESSTSKIFPQWRIFRSSPRELSRFWSQSARVSAVSSWSSIHLEKKCSSYF